MFHKQSLTWVSGWTRSGSSWGFMSALLFLPSKTNVCLYSPVFGTDLAVVDEPEGLALGTTETRLDGFVAAALKNVHFRFWSLSDRRGVKVEQNLEPHPEKLAIIGQSQMYQYQHVCCHGQPISERSGFGFQEDNAVGGFRIFPLKVTVSLQCCHSEVYCCMWCYVIVLCTCGRKLFMETGFPCLPGP